MPDALTVYLHFPCFDGVISAVLAAEYLERKHGWKTGEVVPVDYKEREGWAQRALAKPAAVVDFLYHPQADFWADHHPTTFVTPELEADFRAQEQANRLFNPQAKCCAEVIWSKAFRTLREPRFREMVEWARRIDSAQYESVEEAVRGDAPALRISRSFLRDASLEYCSFLVNALRTQSLDEVAASPRVAELYESVRKATENGQKIFQKKSRLEDDGIVVFNVKQKANAVMSRYAPYLEYPRAAYSVGILDSDEGAKITAMRNPWLRARSVPLGQIFKQYGGGGHQRVASVELKDRSQARRTLGSILKDLRRAASDTRSLREQEAAG